MISMFSVKPVSANPRLAATTSTEDISFFLISLKHQLREIRTNPTILCPFQKKNLKFVSYQAKPEDMLYPIGIQSFETIRKNGYVYIDKTDHIWRLATTGQYYFLSRPRRFGKSLLISTMEAYFSGKKDLFEGLKIADLEKEWIKYPVLRLDLSGATYSSLQVLSEKLSAFLAKYEQQFDIVAGGTVPSVRFETLIEAIYHKTGLPIVLLIDEYDKPILDNLHSDDIAESLRSTLQGFYGVIKSKNDFLKFAFLTGVTKLGKLSVFSALNNLTDISIDQENGDICGITENELRACFSDSVAEMAAARSLSVEACFTRLAKMYDGYHFHPGAPGVYNPFSLLVALRKKEFGEYWFETGTPTFLVRFIQQGDYLLEDITSNGVPASKLTGSNYEKPDVITLLYQSGYLTIKDYDERYGLYFLDYPNNEVESGFLHSLSQYYLPIMEVRGEFSVYRFIKDIESGDVNSLMNRLTALFASSDYQIKGNLEAAFQNTFVTLFRLMGQQVGAELHTSNGRIDVVLESASFVYIIELKRDKTPEEALQQIEEMGYDKPFLAKGKKIFKIGANFTTKNRRLDSWKLAD